MMNELRKAVWAGTLMLAFVGTASSPAGAQEVAIGRKVTKRVTPVYSAIAQQARLSGTVKLLLLVAPDGTVQSIRTLGGNPVLASSAEAAAKQWTYEPLKKETLEPVAFKFEPK